MSIITITDKNIKNEIKYHFPDAYSFITTITDNETTILFKTAKYYGKYTNKVFSLFLRNGGVENV